jgi:hypothetical protein
MMTDLSVRPPEWAEGLLHMVLRRADRESVSGDLLEEYRAAIVPARGECAGDAWYVRQVSWYVWRATWFWALLFGGQFVARGVYDWTVPTHDFHVRAAFSTQFGVVTLLVLALWASWRSGSFAAGPVLAALTSQMAAVFSVSASLLALALLRDSAGHLDRAIAESGGIEEMYGLPFMMIIPALIIGTVGGAIGSVSRRMIRTL